MAVTIQGIEAASPAEKAGLAPGMVLHRLDGHEINDGLDYEFYAARAKLSADVEDERGRRTLVVKKGEYEPLGCTFKSYLIDKQHTCKNKCVFCFVDQMPKGMRPSLYFKDDDERLSFLFGNYVTLTNLNDKEVQRIIDMRIAPVNISVHTANPALRVQMMKNKHAGEVLRYIPQLARAGIQLNTQLVLCPGLNDGPELRRSIEWLAALRPAVQSIAAVPVGVTRHRSGLYPLRTYTKKEAAAQLDIMLEYGDAFAKQQGLRLVYPSDEWFLLAGRPIPDEAFYDGYPQLENGVGMWRLTYEEFMQALEETADVPSSHEADLAVGALAAPLFRLLAQEAQNRFPGLKLHVHEVENRFFGNTITVTGLLTGQDIMEQLRGTLKSDTLLLPDVLLRAEGDLLLDDTTPAQIARHLGVEVQTVPTGGANLLAALLAV